MKEDKLRVGIIGVGVMALAFHIPGLLKTGRAEIVAISRRNTKYLGMAQEKLGVPEAYTDWREMLERSSLDAVVVATPHHLHTEPVLAALKHGLHVLVEKPMALRSEDAWAMVDAAAEAKRTLMVGYNYRFGASGLWRTLKQKLAEGAIGPVRQVSYGLSSYTRWMWEHDEMEEQVKAWVCTAAGMPDDHLDFGQWAAWRIDPGQMGGGMFVDMGTHYVDRLLWLAGAPPVEVLAWSQSAGLPVESFMSVQARLANGAILSLTSADVPAPSHLDGSQQMLISGDLGAVSMGAPDELWLQRRDCRVQLQTQFPDSDCDAAFVATVLDGAPNLVPGIEGAYAVQLMEAAYRSAAEGRIVRIEGRQLK